MGPLQISDGTLTDDPLTMAETLASSFVPVYLQSAPQMTPAPHQLSHSVMDPIKISMQDIHDALYALDPNSAAGPDGVHPIILCDCSESLAYPLFKIFFLSLAEACLPLEWKTSTVTPIFKKGSRYSPLNYRPISLTSVPCKCLERIIVNHLNSYLADQSILSEHQRSEHHPLVRDCTPDALVTTHCLPHAAHPDLLHAHAACQPAHQTSLEVPVC